MIFAISPSFAFPEILNSRIAKLPLYFISLNGLTKLITCGFEYGTHAVKFSPNSLILSFIFFNVKIESSYFIFIFREHIPGLLYTEIGILTVSLEDVSVPIFILIGSLENDKILKEKIKVTIRIIDIIFFFIENLSFLF